MTGWVYDRTDETAHRQNLDIDLPAAGGVATIVGLEADESIVVLAQDQRDAARVASLIQG